MRTDHFSRLLQPLVEKQGLAGAVTCVADQERILALEAVGFADLATRRPMRVDDLFWIASQTKPVTGTAMMMLVDEGKVSLDDPIERYLPEFKDLMVAVPEDTETTLLRRPNLPVTVRHILTHTAGMKFSSPVEQPTFDQLTLHQAALSYSMTPLAADPGTACEYSNMGVNVAGRIIEVVSGMDYVDFLDSRLFAPLGMRDTTFWPDDAMCARLAKTYKPGGANAALEEMPIGQLTQPLQDRSRRPLPAGGLFSTAADCVRFCQMVMGGGIFGGRRYLSEEAVETMTRKQTGDLSGQFGIGWKLDGAIGHDGAYGTHMGFDRERGLITVYLVQHAWFHGEGGNGRRIFEERAREIFAGQSSSGF